MCGMPTLLGKHGSIEPRLAPSLYSSSVVSSENTMFSAGTPSASKYADEERRVRVHVEHARHADAQTPPPLHQPRGADVALARRR